MYKIVVEYETGDSFGSEDTSDTIGPWESLDIAKENLKRLQDHYRFFEKYQEKFLFHQWWLTGKPTEKQILKFKKDTGLDQIPRWIVGDWPYSAILIKDDGTEFQQSVNWTGYFETLYGASIKKVKEDGWSFTV